MPHPGESFNNQADCVTTVFIEMAEGPAPELLVQASSGDSVAFCELCRACEARLIRHAFSLCGDLSQAEDLAQETFLEAWKNLRRYRGECQFFTWLCAILLARYRNSIRRRRPFPFSLLQRGESEDAAGYLERAPDPAAPPDESARQSDSAAVLRSALRRLSPKHHEVIFLRFFVEASLEGIASALRCSVGTVKSRLFYGLEQLRQMKELTEGIRERLRHRQLSRLIMPRFRIRWRDWMNCSHSKAFGPPIRRSVLLRRLNEQARANYSF